MSATTITLPAPRDGHWIAGERATFTYSLPKDAHSEISGRLFPRSGSPVTIVGRAEDDADDNDPELSTIAQRGEAGSLRVYTVRFEDGHEDEAFEDELSEAHPMSAIRTPEQIAREAWQSKIGTADGPWAESVIATTIAAIEADRAQRPAWPADAVTFEDGDAVELTGASWREWGVWGDRVTVSIDADGRATFPHPDYPNGFVIFADEHEDYSAKKVGASPLNRAEKEDQQ